MKIYVILILIFGMFSCEDDKNEIANEIANENLDECNNIASDATTALNLWSEVLDYYMYNDDYPDDGKDKCEAYFDAILSVKNSGCSIDLGGFQNLSDSEIEDLRLIQCDID